MRIDYLKGLIAAPFTPMHKDGEINLSLIPQYYAMLKENGVRGAFINGSTGEGVSLTLNEKKAVAEAWAACGGSDPDFKIMPLLGGTCIKDAIDLAKHAKETGLYAVAFTAPSYFKPADAAQLGDCCLAVAASVPDMPFYYYHIPVLTGVEIPMIQLLQYLHDKMPNLAGIKYTHEDFMDFQSCLNFNNHRYDMLWGRDENMLSALAVGAAGAVGSTFNYAAPLYHRLMDMFAMNDLLSAQVLQQKSIDMIRLLGKYGGISVGKAYMKLIGLDCGEFRLPVKNMDPATYRIFSEEALSLGFAEFCSRKPNPVQF